MKQQGWSTFGDCQRTTDAASTEFPKLYCAGGPSGDKR